MLGSLRKGDFGFVFARPETGKTTFLASEISFMAEQLSDDDGPSLWINNEEQSEKPMLRCIQATLGAS
jgi:replicative DNA helicase